MKKKSKILKVIMEEFNWEYYKHLNPDLFWLGLQTPNEYYNHYINFSNKENRKSKFSDIYPNFNWVEYKKANPTINRFSQSQYEYHYFSIGAKEGLPTNTNDIVINIDLTKFMSDNQNLKYIGLETIDDYKQYYLTIERANPEYKKTIRKPRLGFFLIGFGMPFIDKKVEILKKNLEVLGNIKKYYDIDLYIYIYTVEFGHILNTIDFKKYVSNVYIKVEKGILGEFIYKYVSILYKEYDYTMLFLDDIEFNPNLDIHKLLKVYELEQLDILGFPLTKDSPTNHEFMYVLDDECNYRETNFIEFFTYFISNKNMSKYLQFYNKNTRWCWGIDIALYHKGIRMGMLDLYPIKHYFKAKSYNNNLPNPVDEWTKIKSSFPTIKNKLVLKKEKY